MDMLKFNITKPTAAKFLNDTTKKSFFWLFLYLFGYLQLDLRWFLICIGIAYFGNVVLASKRWKRWQRKLTFNSTNEQTTNLVSDLPGNLPDWVLNPDMHRAEWTNTFIKHLWPHFEDHVRQILHSVETDEGLRKRLSGYHIKSVRFPHVSLGKIPPRLAGVKVHSSTFSSVQRDEIILDLSIQYAGDLCITMEVDLDVNKLPPAKASITQVSLSSSCLRVHLRPLLEDIPFVGACTVSFLRPPDFDFDLDGLANVLAIPGVSLLLRHVIQDQLEQTIVMPNSLTISLVPNIENVKSRILVRQPRDAAGAIIGIPSGVLNVNIVEAKGLENKDFVALGQGKSDPYAVLAIGSDGETSTFKTHVINNNLHPVWNTAIDLPVDNPESLQDMMVHVYDQDIGRKDDFLGKCKISTNVVRTAMTTGQLQDVWKLLEEVKRGSIHVEIGWCELKLSPCLPTKDEGGPVMRAGTSNGTGTGHHQAVLTIVIDSCQNLLNANEGNKMKLPNPSVQCDVCGVFQITDPVIGSINPVFAHRMNFLVNHPDFDVISLSVVDDKGMKSKNVTLGRLHVNISDLLVRTSLSMVKTKFPLATTNQQQQQQKEGKKCPMITLSMALRYIHRPKTKGYGAHKSLQELHTIRQNRSTVGGSVLWRDIGNETSNNKVDLHNAVSTLKDNIERLDDKVRQKSTQGSHFVKENVSHAGDFIYQTGVYGSHVMKTSYDATRAKGAQGVHIVKENVHKVDDYVHQKSAEGSQMVKGNYDAVYQKGVRGTQIVKENIHKVDNYVRETGAQGSQMAKENCDAVYQKGVKGTQIVKENIHKVDNYVGEAGSQGSQIVKSSIGKVDDSVRKTTRQSSQLAKDNLHTVYHKGIESSQKAKENIHKVDNYVRETGSQGSQMVKSSLGKVDDTVRKTARQSSQHVKDNLDTVYQKGIESSQKAKENIHKVDDFVRQTSVQGSEAIKENISKLDDVVRKTGAQGSQMVKDNLTKMHDGIHMSSSLYNRSPSYLETDFNYGGGETSNTHANFKGTTNEHLKASKSFNEGLISHSVKPNFITAGDTSVSNGENIVAPLAQEESLTMTNGYYSLGSSENEKLFKIRPEEATKYVKENSVRPNLKDVGKQQHIVEPPKPKIQLSLKYNLTNMTLSVVVHKILNLQETSVTWLPSAKVVTRVIEMHGLARFRRVVNTKRKTKTQRHNVSPIFEETLEYFLPVGDVKRRRLEVSVYHDSRFPGRFIGRNVVLGRCLVNLDSVADALSENLEKSGTRNATVTEWHILRPPIKNEDLDENGFFRRGSLSRSTSADRKGVVHSNTLPKKGNKRTGSSESFEKEW